MLMSRYQRRNRKKRVIVVTGASAGVGRAIVRELARPGVCLALVARGLDGLEGARRDVEERGGIALVLPCDVADADAVERAAQRIDETFGTIDVWINAAAAGLFAPVHDISPREFERVTQVNYLGYVYGTLAALRRMREHDRGKIIQIGSALGERGMPLQAAGCAARHAVIGFTGSLRSELAHEGSAISLTVVQLPAMNTPHFEHARSKLPHKTRPVTRVYQPEVAAQAVAWACDHDRPEIVVGGASVTTLVRDRLAPRLAARRLARSGYDAQQSDLPEDRDRPDNLFEPVRGDHGVHGRFTEQASPRSVALWANLHRGATAAALLITLLALAAAGFALAWAL